MTKYPKINLIEETAEAVGDKTKITRKYQLIYQKKVKYRTKRFLSRDTLEEYQAKRKEHDNNLKNLQEAIK